jgi:hypothetical protein
MTILSIIFQLKVVIGLLVAVIFMQTRQKKLVFELVQDIFLVAEDKMEGMLNTRDVGTQSTPPDVSSSSSPSPASTPSIIERKRCEVEGGGTPNCNSKLKAQGQVCSANILNPIRSFIFTCSKLKAEPEACFSCQVSLSPLLF